MWKLIKMTALERAWLYSAHLMDYTQLCLLSWDSPVCSTWKIRTTNKIKKGIFSFRRNALGFGVQKVPQRTSSFISDCTISDFSYLSLFCCNLPIHLQDFLNFRTVSTPTWTIRMSRQMFCQQTPAKHLHFQHFRKISALQPYLVAELDIKARWTRKAI